MRKAAWIACWMLAVPVVGVGQPKEASEPKSEVPPNHRLCVLRLTLDGMVVVRTQATNYRLRVIPGDVPRNYYEPYCYDVDKVVKLTDLSLQCADGTAVDETMLRKRLVEATVAVVATPTEFKAEDYRHCKPDTLVILGGAAIGSGPPVGTPGSPPYNHFAPVAPQGSVPEPPAIGMQAPPPPPPAPPAPKGASPPEPHSRQNLTRNKSGAGGDSLLPPLTYPLPPAYEQPPRISEPKKLSVNDDKARLDMKLTGPDRAIVDADNLYQVTLTNIGRRPIGPVGVKILLDQGVGFGGTDNDEAMTSVADNNPFFGDKRLWTVDALAPGGRKTLTMHLTATKPGRLNLAAEARTGDPAVLIDSSISTDFQRGEELDVLDLKVLGPDSPPANETNRFHVTVHNHGQRPVHRVAVALTLEKGLEIVDAPKELILRNESSSVWPFEKLASGESRTLDLNVRSNREGRLEIGAAATGDRDAKNVSPVNQARESCRTTFFPAETAEPPR